MGRYMLPAARLQLYILAQATISSIPTGTLHAHQSISKRHAPCSISTTPPPVPVMRPIEKLTPITYKATCPSRLRGTHGPILESGPSIADPEDHTSYSPWSLLILGPILRSDFLQSLSLVPAGSGSYPQIRSPQSSDLLAPSTNPKPMSTIIDSCWFWIFTTQQVLTTFGPNGGSHHQASPRRHPYSASYEKDARFSSGTQYFPPVFTTWTNSKDMRSQKKSSWKYHMRTRQPLRERLLILINFHWSCSAKGSLPKRREHCFSASCKGAKEKRELYIKTCWPSDSWVQLEQRRVKEAEEHTFQLLFISGFQVQDPKSKIPSPRSQVSDPRSRIRVPGLRLPTLHGGEIQWLHKKASSDHLTTAFPGNKP
ncbi:hypothetical protein F2Q68_00034430 [Brassica cretica]|uniref:Uncharacterized protein n=1 Tax=Brassica cretica TaxID=69181 RepID=A0A8S9H225_BRACR|nr:hypothetical protein F2Q68_00034430 [Brassica cretica]